MQIEHTTQTFDITLNDQLLAGNLSLEQVAAVACLDADEVAWAIEEFGRCDALDASGRELTIVQNNGVGREHE